MDPNVYVFTDSKIEQLIKKVVNEYSDLLVQKLQQQPKYLSRKEAAKKLGITPQTISKYVQDGLIPNRSISPYRIQILETDLDSVKVKRLNRFNRCRQHSI